MTVPFLSPTDTQHPCPRGLNRVISNSNGNVMYTQPPPPPHHFKHLHPVTTNIFTVKSAEGDKANV